MLFFFQWFAAFFFLRSPDKMCEYVKYKLKPSELAELLGEWGPRRQFEAIANLIKEPVAYEPNTHAKFLADHSLTAHWAKLQSDANLCDTQDHIAHLSEMATQALTAAVNGSNLDVQDTCSSLRKSLISRAHRAYGRNNERRFVCNFNSCAEPAKQIHSQQQEVFQYLSDDRKTCAVVGKIDGFMGKELIEIKHRTDCLRHELPTHELMQVHAYMFATGKESCTVIQCVRRLDVEATDMMQVRFDQHFWASMLQRIQRVVGFADQLSASPLTWDSFKSCSMEEKKRLMETYI
jgi:hypothetical protein